MSFMSGSATSSANQGEEPGRKRVHDGGVRRGQAGAERKVMMYGAAEGERVQPGTVLVSIWVVTVACLAPSSTDSWPWVEVKVLVVPAGTVAENRGEKLAGLMTWIQQGAWVVT